MEKCRSGLAASMALLGCLLSFVSLAAAEDCVVGYSSEHGSCQPCTPGFYYSKTGCAPCPSGTAAGTQRDQGLRFFSFDANTEQAGVTLMNFADPTSAESGWGTEGLVFDGEDDHVVLESWEIGGAMSVEVFVKYESFNSRSRVFDFGNGEGSDNIVLCNGGGTSSNAEWGIHEQGSSVKYINTSSNFWVLGEWVHVVATVTDGGAMAIYKNGVLKGSNPDGIAPITMIRIKHYVGGSHWANNDYFHGTIRYVGVYDRALALVDQSTATTAFHIGLAGASRARARAVHSSPQ